MHTTVLSTCGSRNEAERIARDLVGRRLAACVNIIPVSSYYRWKGRINADREYLIIAKTRSKIFAKLKRRILILDSYELPELLSLKIDGGYKKYLNWIDKETRK
jgi:periplasmic divalent cation tolerance protein